MRELAGLNVCFVAGTLGQGGAERQLFYVLKTLRESGANARVLALAPEESFWEPLFVGLGVPVQWIGPGTSKWSRFTRILRAVRRGRFDIVQSQHFFTNLYACGAARMSGLPDVGAIRNTLRREIQSVGPLLGGLSLRMPRVIAANSRAAVREAAGRGVPASRLCFLPNVVDTDLFVPSAGPPSESFRLLAVGRLVPQKRLDRFVSLLSRLRREMGNRVVGRIVGSGPLRDDLVKHASREGLPAEALEIHEAISDVREVYRCADVLVLTSDSEGTPNVVLEAMASGLPVVAARVGGVEEVLRHGDTGYLANSEDANGFLGPLVDLARDPALRQAIGRAAREDMLASRSVRLLPALLTDLYSRAIA